MTDMEVADLRTRAMSMAQNEFFNFRMTEYMKMFGAKNLLNPAQSHIDRRAEEIFQFLIKSV